MKKKILLLSIFAMLLMLSMPVMSSIQVGKVTTDTETLQTVKGESKCGLCAMGFNFENKKTIKPTYDDSSCLFYFMMLCIVIKNKVTEPSIFINYIAERAWYCESQGYIPPIWLLAWC